jgi:riboflavin kinase/FMN adenylyltransferase
LEEAGLDAIWLLPFTQELSRMSGRDFAGEFFHRRLAARAVVMGETASFGCGRDGNARSLSLWARDWDMRILTAPALPIHGAIVSSTAIRLAVRTGDLRRAAEFLGRPFSLEGTVVRGQGRGRKLGFPTLNLDPHHELRPPPGVYLTRTRVAGQALPSLTNIGRPPTETEIESGLSDFVIETHLLDFDANLYGQAVEVIFSEKIRDVMRFDRESELARQVVGDINQARRWFASHPED